MLIKEEFIAGIKSIPYTAKCSSSNWIFLDPSTSLAIMSVGPSFIQIDNWSPLQPILPHPSKVCMSLLNDAWLLIIMTSIVDLFITALMDIHVRAKQNG